MDVLIIGALGALVLYVAACAMWPFMNCRRCTGTGKRRSPGGRAWRACGRCEGTGTRVRLGRWLFEAFRSSGQ